MSLRTCRHSVDLVLRLRSQVHKVLSIGLCAFARLRSLVRVTSIISIWYLAMLIQLEALMLLKIVSLLLLGCLRKVADNDLALLS